MEGYEMSGRYSSTGNVSTKNKFIPKFSISMGESFQD